MTTTPIITHATDPAFETAAEFFSRTWRAYAQGGHELTAEVKQELTRARSSLESAGLALKPRAATPLPPRETDWSLPPAR